MQLEKPCVCAAQVFFTSKSPSVDHLPKTSLYQRSQTHPEVEERSQRSAIIPITSKRPVAINQLKDFLNAMQNDENLKMQVIAASTADDVAQIALDHGFEFSGDELLRFSGQKVGRVTVSKQEHPGEYN